MENNQLKHWRYSIGIIALLIILISNRTAAQSSSGFTTQAISATPIQISDQLTTNLIFPQPIKSVDRGSRDILVQRANEVENILQVKAEKQNLETSNLTVITEDGHFYSFLVNYEKSPKQLNLRIQPQSANVEADFPEGTSLETEVMETARRVAVKNRQIKPIRQRRYMTGLGLHGIYIDKDLLYFQFKLENQTNITYDIEQFRFFIKDNKKGKRTASQQLEQIPIQVLGNIQQIPAQSTETIVVSLSKFTIPDQKHLTIALMEEKGGRHLRIKVKNRHIITAALVD